MMLCFFFYIIISVFCQNRTQIIENQLNQLLNSVKNKNVAILTNPTAIDGNLNLLVERILAVSKQYNITIKCFFAAEHGLRGDQQAGKGDPDYIDQETNIPVYSLYGVRKAPQLSQLVNVDAFIYDIQDVGARYYTYIWTLTYTIQVLSKTNIKLYIFDRPNPLGRDVEGCPLTLDAGTIGRLLPKQKYSIPVRYGLTIGYLPPFDLEIIKMSKPYQFKQSDWVLSSPNMPTLSTVHAYPGMGFFQGTSISEGRGTCKPFQLSGFPNITASQILKYFKTNNITISGAILREAYFIPTFSKHLNEVCGGIEIHITEPSKYKSVQTSLNILKAFITLNSNITISSGIDKLFGKLGFSQAIKVSSVQSILKECQADRNDYIQNYKKYWIYNEVYEELM